MNKQVREALIEIISKIPGDIRTGGEGWAMAGALDRIAAIWPKPLDVGEIVTFILAEFTSADFCGCYEGDSDEVFGDGVKGLAQAIAARFCAPVERVCNGHYVTEHEHGSLNNVTVSVAVLLTACGKRQPADSRYCQDCGGKIKIEG